MKSILISWALLFLGATQVGAVVSISGTVADLDGNGIANVEVSTGGVGAPILTSSTGYYEILNITEGASYTVTPSRPNHVFTPATRSYTALVSNQVGQNYTFGKKWDGGGSDALASTPQNWTSDQTPVAGDIVRLDDTNAAKGCFWDLTTEMTLMQMKPTFSSSVVAGVDMDLGAVEIAGGRFDMRAYGIYISSHFTHSGGTFTAAENGSAYFDGTALQRVTMVKNSLGGNYYGSTFFDFRVTGSSTVQALSDLVVDGSFVMSAGGRFEAGGSTITLTGGHQVGTGSGSNFDWNDYSGDFIPGSGAVVFNSPVRSYWLRQGPSNSFSNLSAYGTTGIDVLSNVTVNGNLTVGQTGSSVHISLGNSLIFRVGGTAAIGPASTLDPPTISIGASTMTFQGNVLLGTATLSVTGGLLNVQGSQMDVTSQGTLIFQPGALHKIYLWDNSFFKLTGGTLRVLDECIFASTAPGVTRFGLEMNGNIDIQAVTRFDSMNKNGFHMGLGANPVHLDSMDFLNGVVGGAAFYFDPVTVASVTIDSPQFDDNISTNVRAVIDGGVMPNADVNVIHGLGDHSGPSYEVDPSSVVNWGVLGTPTGVAGNSIGTSSITWSWAIVGDPLRFVVMATSGGAVSPNLDFDVTEWTEVGLSTNTQYERQIRAFTDSAQADSAAVAVYTDAAPATNLAVVDLGISSITLSWSANTNPSPTAFYLDRSTNGTTYTQIASGTYAGLVPYNDVNLLSERWYYYRVRVANGGGAWASPAVTVSTKTLPVPPPSILSIAPASVENLGDTVLSVTGVNIQAGAILRLKRTGSISLLANPVSVGSAYSITGTFDLTGTWAGAWDVEIENPDGGLSGTSGTGLLTISNATSQGSVTIQSYSPASSLSFSTIEGNSSLLLPASLIPVQGRVYVANDPANNPLTVDPAIITAANAALSGYTLVPGSIREILTFTSQGRYNAGFNGTATLYLHYPDANGDGVVDQMTVRSSALRIMVLDETAQRWTLITGSSLDS
ncbi:MAG: carboxypeptidase-like regulatory domain-containing protein, partial [Elusimicrobia bacterium]|nr:carboxypeptidase-like regulatory domain-containing protein [Candidatus Obscuribacterium magneticum]